MTVALSVFETENLAAGIASNAQGLPAAAAGTFLGGITFLALGIAGMGGLIAPMPVRLPAGVAAWTAAAPLPLLAVGIDGRISRLEGALLLVWFALSPGGLARCRSRSARGRERGARPPAAGSADGRTGDADRRRLTAG